MATVASPNLGREGDSTHIKNFLEENNYTFPVLLDEQADLVLQYGITAFPSTIIIDPNGVIQKYVRGSMNKENMKYLIESVSKSSENTNN